MSAWFFMFHLESFSNICRIQSTDNLIFFFEGPAGVCVVNGWFKSFSFTLQNLLFFVFVFFFFSFIFLLFLELEMSFHNTTELDFISHGFGRWNE